MGFFFEVEVEVEVEVEEFVFFVIYLSCDPQPFRLTYLPINYYYYLPLPALSKPSLLLSLTYFSLLFLFLLSPFISLLLAPFSPLSSLGWTRAWKYMK